MTRYFTAAPADQAVAMTPAPRPGPLTVANVTLTPQVDPTRFPLIPTLYMQQRGTMSAALDLQQTRTLEQFLAAYHAWARDVIKGRTI